MSRFVPNPTEDYDALPFLGETVPHAHPEFLETVARVRGMRPAQAAFARVLELGCGVGTNLFPMAERYPQARFLGIDLAARQIAIATTLAAEYGLTNVEFRVGDIADLGRDLGQFDYLFTHGVYSWVESPVRDALLEACRRHLAEQGVAYVGYKTYPAWHLHEMIRQMLLYGSRSAATREEKLTQARNTITLLQQAFSRHNPYSAAVPAELSRLSQATDDYLWHEYLEAVSHPVYFHQFVAHAKEHGLRFLGDGAAGIRRYSQIDPAGEQQLAAYRDAFEREQLRDVLTNRAFRQTLLCHQQVELTDTIAPDAMQSMYLEGAFSAAGGAVNLHSSASQDFVHRSGGRITVSERLLKAAITHLGDCWPAYVRFDDLVAESLRRVAAAGGAPATSAETDQLGTSLAQGCGMLVFMLHSHAAPFLARPSERPVASAVARRQARTRAIVASRRHEPAPLNPLDRWLIAQLDGTHTLDALIELAAAQCAAGKLVVTAPGGTMRGDAEARRFFETEIPRALARLADSALLVG